MPEINLKVNKNIISETGSMVKETDNISEDDIIIHTIPRKFFTASLPNSKAKGIGMLILISGGVVLILGGAFMYFYIFSSNSSLVRESQVGLNNDVNSGNENKATDSEVTVKDKTSDMEENKSKETTKNMNENGTSSPDQAVEIPVETATSTVTSLAEEQATTTGNIVNEATGTNLITPADSDNDGLFDIEESLYGSEVNLRDSDGDKYEDLVEILKLYNPAGKGGIIVNDYIEKYVNTRFAYYLYYPSVWPVSNVGGEDSVVFDTGNNQFVQVIVQINPDRKTLSEWYLANSNLSVIDNNQILYKPGWEGVKSPDGLTVYLTKPNLDFIIIMTYSLGASNILNYKNIFSMMVNSLEN